MCTSSYSFCPRQRRRPISRNVPHFDAPRLFRRGFLRSRARLSLSRERLCHFSMGTRGSFFQPKNAGASSRTGIISTIRQIVDGVVCAPRSRNVDVPGYSEISPPGPLGESAIAPFFPLPPRCGMIRGGGKLRLLRRSWGRCTGMREFWLVIVL